jgi:hypothetical protein
MCDEAKQRLVTSSPTEGIPLVRDKLSVVQSSWLSACDDQSSESSSLAWHFRVLDRLSNIYIDKSEGVCTRVCIQRFLDTVKQMILSWKSICFILIDWDSCAQRGPRIVGGDCVSCVGYRNYTVSMTDVVEQKARYLLSCPRAPRVGHADRARAVCLPLCSTSASWAIRAHVFDVLSTPSDGRFVLSSMTRNSVYE